MGMARDVLQALKNGNAEVELSSKQSPSRKLYEDVQTCLTPADLLIVGGTHALFFYRVIC
jgi:hypothetical protein